MQPKLLSHFACAVVIPTKNRPRLLNAAVLSALEAVRPVGGEVIVVDDNGTPPAGDSLAGIGGIGRDLRIFRNLSAPGPSGARNFGVSMTQAPVIFFLDDDDRMLPDYCRRILEGPLRNARPPDFGFSDAIGGRSALRALGTGALPENLPLRLRTAGLGMGVWIRREVFLAIGGVAEDISMNEDTELFLRLAGAGCRGWYEAAPGVRLRDGSALAGEMASMTKSSRPEERVRSFKLILSRHRDLLAQDPVFLRGIQHRIVKYHIRSGARRKALGFAASQRANTLGLLLHAISRPGFI